MDDRTWDEYYLGLVITLVGSLKYPELEPAGRQLALMGAATARGLMGKPVGATTLTPESSQPIPVQGRGGVAVVEPPTTRPPARPTRWLGRIGQIFGRKPALGLPLALIINVEGQVEVRRKTSDRVVPAAFGMPLFAEDAVITYEASTSDVVCHNGFLFHLDRHSTLIVRCGEPPDQPPLGRLPPDLSRQLAKPGAGTRMSWADLAAAEQSIRALPLSPRAQSFLRARLYQQGGWSKEAITELEALINLKAGPGLALALGKAYYQAGALNRAAANYTAALSEAQLGDDRLGQAEVHLGLGRVARANYETEAAFNHLQTAEALYQQEGYFSRAKEVAALLPPARSVRSGGQKARGTVGRPRLTLVLQATAIGVTILYYLGFIAFMWSQPTGRMVFPYPEEYGWTDIIAQFISSIAPLLLCIAPLLLWILVYIKVREE